MTLNKRGLVYDLYTFTLSLNTRSNLSKFNSCLNELMLNYFIKKKLPFSYIYNIKITWYLIIKLL